MKDLRIILGISWIIFWLFWLIAAFKSKPNIRQNARHFIAFRVILLIILIVALTNRSINFHHNLQINNSFVVWLGAALFVVGLALALWARKAMGRNWGMPRSLKKEPELVTNGPFAYIRHPIYSGVILASIGSILAINLAFIIIFLLYSLIFISSAYAEEKTLIKVFPKEYPIYRSKTKMFIPYVF